MTRLAEDIFNPHFWSKRLAKTGRDNLHHAVFLCHPPIWQTILEKHKEILSRHILPHHSILDVGCGWGRLLDLMPDKWDGSYLGVDLCPDFISMAEETYLDTRPKIGGKPIRRFRRADLRDGTVLNELRLAHFLDNRKFDWAILISMRTMVNRNAGEYAWTLIESNVRANAHNLLYLEYNPEDDGSVE